MTLAKHALHRTGKVALLAIAAALAIVCAGIPDAYAAGYHDMWRMYNPWSGEHFYTADRNEAKQLASIGWYWEGVGWVAPDQGDTVWRLYNPWSGEHHYTLSDSERKALIALGWSDEGKGWASDPSHSVAVLRQYNPYDAGAGAHNYTTATAERDELVSLGWRDEGVGWWAADTPSPVQTITPFWLDGPNGNRARVLADGSTATGRFVVDDNEYWGMPGSGWVVRRTWLAPDGTIVRADADGVLLQEGSLTGNAELDAAIDWVIVNKTGTGEAGLRAAYDYISTFRYTGQDRWADDDWQSWSVSYALEFWKNQGGNCYRFAAFTYWMARGLGYDNVAIKLGLLRNLDGFLDHGWVEFYTDTATLIIDSEMPHEAPEYEYFLIPYPETPMEYFDRNANSLG